MAEQDQDPKTPVSKAMPDLRNIPESINNRLSEISSDKECFDKAKSTYQDTLNKSGYKYNLSYKETSLKFFKSSLPTPFHGVTTTSWKTANRRRVLFIWIASVQLLVDMSRVSFFPFL